MSKLVSKNGWALIKRYDEAKSSDNPFSSLLVPNSNLGIIVTTPSKKFKEGNKVYFVNQSAKFTLADGKTEVLAVKEEDIVAVVED